MPCQGKLPGHQEKKAIGASRLHFHILDNNFKVMRPLNTCSTHMPRMYTLRTKLHMISSQHMPRMYTLRTHSFAYSCMHIEAAVIAADLLELNHINTMSRHSHADPSCHPSERLLSHLARPCLQFCSVH